MDACRQFDKWFPRTWQDLQLHYQNVGSYIVLHRSGGPQRIEEERSSCDDNQERLLLCSERAAERVMAGYCTPDQKWMGDGSQRVIKRHI